MAALDSHNRIVHGMWVGGRLSKLELLTLHSFVTQGHEFHLWAYTDIRAPLPKGVVLRDAATIIPRAGVFKKTDTDPETGVGRNSFGAPFSDLFRYKLLYTEGGYWADMDMTCLKPLDFAEEYVFRSHRIGVVGNIIKCPARSQLMRSTFEMTAMQANENSEWLLGNRILTENIRRLGLTRFTRNDICSEDSWWTVVKPYIESDVPLPDHLYVVHWINEFWRTLTTENGFYRGTRLLNYLPDKDEVRSGTTLGKLYRKYNLI
jgi:hypothetical protein